MRNFYLKTFISLMALCQSAWGTIGHGQVFSCYAQKTDLQIELKVDINKLRHFRIITGADHFDSRLNNDAVEMLISSSSSSQISISSREGFSYYDSDLSSVVSGKVNENFLDDIRIEIFYFLDHRGFVETYGNIFLSSEIFKRQVYENITCRLKE